MKTKEKKPKSYKFVGVTAKILQPIFNILFYAAIVFVCLFVILAIILFFVNMPVDEMLLPPFMHKIKPYNNPTLEAYVIQLGNGVKITTAAENVTLGNVKTVFFAGINVVIFVLLTLAPIFRFLESLLENINKKRFFDSKNARYIMFIGLCISVGTIAIRFMTQFYNYYLLTQFITDAQQDIDLQLGVDVLSGVTGVAIIFIGLIFAYICQVHNIETEPHANSDITDIVRK